jgi:hypothetical protein
MWLWQSKEIKLKQLDLDNKESEEQERILRLQKIKPERKATTPGTTLKTLNLQN